VVGCVAVALQQLKWNGNENASFAFFLLGFWMLPRKEEGGWQAGGKDDRKTERQGRMRAGRNERRLGGRMTGRQKERKKEGRK